MMSLEDFMEDCVAISIAKTPAATGGAYEAWADSLSFKAAISTRKSAEAPKAGGEDVAALFTVITAKEGPLAYNSHFRRLATGEYYRVTSNPLDFVPPIRSTLSFCQMSAEKVKKPETE